MYLHIVGPSYPGKQRDKFHAMQGAGVGEIRANRTSAPC